MVGLSNKPTLNAREEIPDLASDHTAGVAGVFEAYQSLEVDQKKLRISGETVRLRKIIGAIDSDGQAQLPAADFHIAETGSAWFKARPRRSHPDRGSDLAILPLV